MFARSGAPSKRPSRESRSRDPIGNLLRCGRTSTATSSDLTRRPPSLASRSTTWRVLALIRLTLAHAWDENEVSRAGHGRPAPRLLPFVPSESLERDDHVIRRARFTGEPTVTLRRADILSDYRSQRRSGTAPIASTPSVVQIGRPTRQRRRGGRERPHSQASESQRVCRESANRRRASEVSAAGRRNSHDRATTMARLPLSEGVAKTIAVVGGTQPVERPARTLAIELTYT